MPYLRIHDHVFDRTLTLRQAYSVFQRFIAEYNARGETSTVELLTNIWIANDGTSCDPAQVYDFVRIAADVLDDDGLRDAVRR